MSLKDAKAQVAGASFPFQRAILIDNDGRMTPEFYKSLSAAIGGLQTQISSIAIINGNLDAVKAVVEGLQNISQPAWGNITGYLSSQLDLDSALSYKLNHGDTLRRIAWAF